MTSDIKQYKFPLDKKTEKKAEKELNEIPKERLGALTSFRDWVLQQQYWLKCPTDTSILLAFLRTAKFAQLKARERFINFWTKRSQYPDWFRNLDTDWDKTVKILRSGVCFILPGRDSEGRKIILGRWGLMDYSGESYTRDEFIAALNVLLDWLLLDEEAQVNGVVFLLDVGGVTMKHQAFLGIDAMRTMTTMWFKSSPVRYKQLHYYNAGAVFETIFAIIKPMMPAKVVQRTTFHGNNMTSVYDKIDKTLLPDEYLPDAHKGASAGPIGQIVENGILELHKAENRDILVRMSSSECVAVDLTKKPDDAELLGESFRMLNHRD